MTHLKIIPKFFFVSLFVTGFFVSMSFAVSDPTVIEKALDAVDVNAAPPETLKTETITLQYAKPDEVKVILENMKSPQGQIILNSPVDSQGKPTFAITDAPQPLEQMLGLIKEIDVPVEVRTFDLKYLTGQDVAQILRQKLTPNVGRLNLNEDQPRQIVVIETPTHIGDIASVIEQLDQPSREVLLESKTLQIVLNDEHPQGVDWEAIVSDFQNFSFQQQELVLGTISEEDYTVLLEALNTVGIPATIATHRVTVNDNEGTSLMVKPVKIFTEQELEVRRATVNAANLDPQGLQLILTPKVADKMFRVKIRSESMPIQDEKIDHSATTAIEVEEGSTIVIGGFFAQTMCESTRKIPLLGDLPLLGFAFRNERQRIRKSEVITFITPKAIVKEEVKERIKELKD